MAQFLLTGVIYIQFFAALAMNSDFLLIGRVSADGGTYMTESGYIIALDQGTTGTTGMLMDAGGSPLWTSSREIEQIYPRPGWVEHDPAELFESCLEVIEDLLDTAELHPRAIRAIGITNQRETLVMWDRRSGEPVHNAIVWQCRRTAELCEGLREAGCEEIVRRKTGLPIDAYFSGTKIRWLLDEIPDGQRRAERGELACGTVDSWLIWNFTNKLVHATDATNASRTMLFDIDKLAWDDELLAMLNVPRAILPEVMPSSEVYGYLSGDLSAGQPVPISGVAGDQHASMFGQACFEMGAAKNTYGTGCFALANTGGRRVGSASGLITALGWTLGDETVYALEGSVFSAGATLQWLRDGLGIIDSAAESEALASQAADNGGVYFVPAFSGLGAPHWDMYARGTIVGLTRGTTKAHIARAALEAIAYQTRDVLDAMRQDTGGALSSLRVDGGGADNGLLMQFQADMLGVPVERSAVRETTALGAGWLAGLGVGIWSDPAQLGRRWQSDAVFTPRMDAAERERLYGEWKRAASRSMGWSERRRK